MAEPATASAQSPTAATSPEPAIVTRALSKRFDGQLAVDALDLTVPRGALFGLIGPNGAGKTTTLRMLAGLIPPTSGRIELAGRPIEGQAREVSRLVGYMPDFFGVYEDMRTWEYLDFYARCYDLPRERRRIVVDELLELVDLAGKRDSDVEALSRGMKQRLCLAHALVHDPDILLLDEPASGLDPRARLEMRALLRELQAMGKTIVISSHILSELAEMCDAVGIMERGKLLDHGPVDAIERRLQLGGAVRVHVPGAVEAARDVLAELQGVTVVADGALDGDWLEITLGGDIEARAAVLRALVAAQLPVAAFVPRERDLEGLFMRVTKGEVA